MHTITLSWKPFNLDLEALDKSLRAKYPTYVGNQASNKLELFFTEDPSAIPMTEVMEDRIETAIEQQEQITQKQAADPTTGELLVDESGNPVMEDVVEMVDVEVQKTVQVAVMVPSGLPSIKEDVEAIYEAITETSPEVASYRTTQQIANAIQTLKEGIPAKTWNQMTVVERRLQMGLNVTKEELIAAGVL